MDTGIRSNTKYEHASEMSDHILKYSDDRTHPMLLNQTLDVGLEIHVYFKISFISADRQISLRATGQVYEG